MGLWRGMLVCGLLRGITVEAHSDTDCLLRQRKRRRGRRVGVVMGGLALLQWGDSISIAEV